MPRPDSALMMASYGCVRAIRDTLGDDSGDHASQVFAGRLLGSVGGAVGDRLYDPLQLAE
jgi:GGDEF domain-containing protein